MKKLFAALLALCLALCFSVSALAVGDFIINESAADIHDYFSREELDELNTRAEVLCRDLGVAPYFILVDDMGGMSIGDYSEWYYLEHDFIPVDAIVMIADMKTGETAVYADGSVCLDKLTVKDLDKMKAAYDESETYGGGVQAFFFAAERSLGFDAGKALVVSLVIGAAAAVVTAIVLRGQLKSVRTRKGAADYTRPGSMSVTESYERFLYRHVDRTTKSRDGMGGGSTAKAGGGLRSS